jgi:superfamily II DNA or RNA helicase
MTPSQTKDKVQRHGLNLWFENGTKGTLEYATGVGKTRCGVLAANYFANSLKKDVVVDAPILILAPTRTIRDRVWEKEFEKWGFLELYKEKVHTECIQTAYKWQGKSFGLVIIDEIHNSLTGEYMKFYQNNSYLSILGLTATIPDNKRSLLNSIAPTVHSITVEQALRHHLVSPYRIYNLAISFTEEERANYQKYTKVIDELQEQGTNAWGLISKRSKILHAAYNKMAATKEIASWFPDKYGLIFSQYQTEVESIAFELGKRAQYYHGGTKGKVEEAIIASFCDISNPVNILVSAKRLNEGADFPYVSFAIIQAGTSSKLVQTQQLGRIIRVEEGKQAFLIRLYVPGTKDEAWLSQSQRYMTSGLSSEIKYVKSIEELKELLLDVV